MAYTISIPSALHCVSLLQYTRSESYIGFTFTDNVGFKLVTGALCFAVPVILNG